MTDEQAKIFETLIKEIRNAAARGAPVVFDAETAAPLADLLEGVLQLRPAAARSISD